MQMQSDIHLHLSIWRPVMIDRRYLYETSQTDNEDIFVPVDNGRLLEQVYAWDAGANDVLGACSSAVGKKIKERLVDPFASSEIPENRTIWHFQEAINSILTDRDVQNETHWTDCQEIVESSGGDEVNLRANIALAMLQHFHWVSSVFLDVPRASVLIR